jgi:hypothetical protein
VLGSALAAGPRAIPRADPCDFVIMASKASLVDSIESVAGG